VGKFVRIKGDTIPTGVAAPNKCKSSTVFSSSSCSAKEKSKDDFFQIILFVFTNNIKYIFNIRKMITKSFNDK